MTLDLGGEFRTTAAQVGEPAAADPYAEIIENCRASQRSIKELEEIIGKLQNQVDGAATVEKARGLVGQSITLLQDSKNKLEALGLPIGDCVPPTKPETIKAP